MFDRQFEYGLDGTFHAFGLIGLSRHGAFKNLALDSFLIVFQANAVVIFSAQILAATSPTCKGRHALTAGGLTATRVGLGNVREFETASGAGNVSGISGIKTGWGSAPVLARSCSSFILISHAFWITGTFS